jgi:ubiquinone/menaquinone biosynthesis C-methylase UbiE
MDKWFYYGVTHRLHTYCNPVSEEGVGELEEVLDLSPSMRVLDIASGLGEMLVGFAERHGISGVGVDLSPQFLERAKERLARATSDVDVEFVLADGAAYCAETDERFDVVMCIGASWIWEGYEGTMRAMLKAVKPGGLIVTGEPFWREDPPDEYLEIEELKAEDFTTPHEYLEQVAAMGPALLWMRAASQQEWDRYEMLQTASFDAFARENPEHPELEAVRGKLMPSKDAYLRWGRECLGFALWVWRAPA